MNLIKVDRFISSAKNWSDLFEKIRNLEKEKDKGDVFERFVQVFLLTKPRYVSLYKNIWLLGEVPNNFKKKLNLPKDDEGIDLVCQTFDDKFHSIQAKYRYTKSLKKDELTGFTDLTYNYCKNFDQAHLFHTSRRRITKEKYLKISSYVGWDEWFNLSPEDWQRIKNFLKKKEILLKPRKPRRHQTKAIKSARKYFDSKFRRGKMIMPCGTGKSLSAFWIAQELSAKTIVVALPSLSLIKQSLDDWTREYLALKTFPEWMCVCSDSSVGEVNTDSFNNDTYDLGIKTTTNLKEIGAFLKKRSKGPKVVFTTYQSSPILAKASKDSKTKFDLAIFDEAHKTVGSKSKRFATLLSEKKINIEKRLFMTATERIFKGNDDEVLSMDDEKIYGQRFYQMSFKAAIEQNIISDYRVVTMTISDETLLELIEKNNFISDENKNLSEVESTKLAAGISLKKAFKKYGINHAISFHRSIESADAFRKQQDVLNSLKTVGPKIANSHISSKKSAGERAKLMQEFSCEKKALMTNARCLTEGIDVPAIDAVLFADPKQSVVDIVQAAGRALRKHKKKKFGYILLPITIPRNQSFEEYSEKTAFKNVSKIIAALSTQDERIAEEFRLINSGKKIKGKIINIDIDVKGSKKVQLEYLSNNINLKLWKKVGRVNFMSFDKAKKFVRENQIDSQSKYRSFLKKGFKPIDLPSNPQLTYKGYGWKSWGDFFGTGYIASQNRKYRDFKEARSFVHSLKLKSQKDWMIYSSTKRPDDIPSQPAKIYANKGYISLGDWLGTGRVSPHKLRENYVTFFKARKYVRKLKFTSAKEWQEYCKSGKKPENIPSNPGRVYKKTGFVDLKDFIGFNYINNADRNFCSYKEAQKFALKLGISSEREWREYKRNNKLPSHIPGSPERIYKNKGWKGYSHFLTGKIQAPTQKMKFRSYTLAKKYVHSLKLNSYREWQKFASSNLRPKDIPSHPSKTYKNKGWIDVYDWLGTRKR